MALAYDPYKIPFFAAMRLISIVSAGCMVGLLAGCASKPYSATNKVYRKQSKSFAAKLREQPAVNANDSQKAPEYFVGTTNFSMRKPNYVVIHYTEQNSCEQTLQTFTMPKTEVSAHYVICRNGVVHHMLNDYLRAHHAGLGKWGSVMDMNSCSIGIELDNNGKEPFADAQMASLISLLGQLKKAYNIPTANFIGHSDFAPTRKIDPGTQFPWKRLADAGFGIWYDDNGEDIPAAFSNIQALRIIGYDTKDSTAAIRAFKQHYMQQNSPKLTDEDRRALYSLMKKYY